MDETVRLEGNGLKPPVLEEDSLEDVITVDGVPMVPPEVMNALARGMGGSLGVEAASVAEAGKETGGRKASILEMADIPAERKNAVTVPKAEEPKCAGTENVLDSESRIVNGKVLALRIHFYNTRMGISGRMSEDLMDFVVKKKEEHYIDKFKNQNALMKKFGEDGIKVYVVLDEKKSMGQMLQESGVSEDKFIEILDFMDKEGMVKLEHQVPETALLKPVEAPKTEKPAEQARPQVTPYVPPARTAAPITPKIEITQQAEPEEDRVRVTQPAEEKKTPPVPGIMRDEHTSTPLPPEYHREKLIQPKEEMEIRPPKPAIEITQASEESVKTEIEAPKPEDLLSPLERIIFDKFGREGVNVYNLIDGEKTAEQILNETKISESKLVEILEFMDDEGIIKLEKPGKKGTAPQEKQAIKEPQFEPIVDDEREYQEPLTPAEKAKANPIVLPSRQSVGLFTKMETRLKLSLKYRGSGQKLLAAVDGKKDVVELSKELGIPLEQIDRILVSLTKRNVVSTSPLSDDDVKDRYGSDGLKIYRRYGRDGIMVYELIGREKSLKDVILRSRVEPKRAVEIVMFIHRVLDLGLPLEKGALYAQLGIKERPN